MRIRVEIWEVDAVVGVVGWFSGCADWVEEWVADLEDLGGNWGGWGGEVVDLDR